MHLWTSLSQANGKISYTSVELDYNNHIAPLLPTGNAAFLTVGVASETYSNKTDASTTYLSIETATNDYLSKTDAVSSYLSKTDAINTYLSIEDATNDY